VAKLPEIAFFIAFGIRMVVGYILWMHAMHMFQFIKDEMIRKFIATGLSILFESAFLASSLVTAKLRMVGMAFWANAFLAFTVVGSLIFNGLYLYYFQDTAVASQYIRPLSVNERFQVLVFLQFANIVSIVMAEAVGFMLASESFMGDTGAKNRQEKIKEDNNKESRNNKDKENSKNPQNEEDKDNKDRFPSDLDKELEELLKLN
ncbi:MAG: hypothetical protein EAY81_00050, partial [Bacteroidetes bacterium]